MEENKVDWESNSVINAISAWSINGLGPGQCDSPKYQNEKPTIYLVRILGRTNSEHLDIPTHSFSLNIEDFLRDVRSRLTYRLAGSEIDVSDIDIYDYLGYEFLTIRVRLFPYVPQILNSVLEAGYSFITHPSVKVLYEPGEVFSLQSFEEKVIIEMKKRKEFWEKYDRRTWSSLDSTLPVWRLAKEHNWSTVQGKIFAQTIRSECDREGHDLFLSDTCRIEWKSYQDLLNKYKILEAGSWTRNNLVWPISEQGEKDEGEQDNMMEDESSDSTTEDEDTCIICLDNPPTTTVLPCMHQVVCDKCSHLLKSTNDSNICVRCRRTITHVLYQEDNFVEIK